MTHLDLTSFFAWSTIINYVVLMVWLLIFTIGQNWMYSIHRDWFKLNESQFNIAQYIGMAILKIFILVFNLAPYVALRIIG